MSSRYANLSIQHDLDKDLEALHESSGRPKTAMADAALKAYRDMTDDERSALHVKYPKAPRRAAITQSAPATR